MAALVLASSAMGQGYVCAEGGGNAGKGAWADEVFGWMVEKGGRGAVVVIGAVKLDEDERLGLFTRLGAASAVGLVVDEANADSKAVAEQIAAAKVVFIRGGAQDRYVRWWKGTGAARAIVEVWKNGGVVGGASAGCAVLGEVVYDAVHGSLSARDALSDARHPDLTLTTGFLDLVPGVLFDTHFTERGRLGRLPVMLAVAHEDLKKDLLGIGVDPRTAVCIGPDGIAEIKGEGTATILALSERGRISLEAVKPPAVTGVMYAQLCAGYRYDLNRRIVVSRPEGIEERGAAPDRMDLPGMTLTVDGDDFTAASAGAFVTEGDDGAWLDGGIKERPGRGVFRQFVFTPMRWEKGVAEAMQGAQGALADHPGLISVWVDALAGARVFPGGLLEMVGGPMTKRATLVLDGRGATHAGRGPGVRKAPVLERAVLHVLPPGWSVDLEDGAGIPPESSPP